MKVALFHNVGSGGGALRVIQEYVKGLASKGHDITCFVPEKLLPLYEAFSKTSVKAVPHTAPGHFNQPRTLPYLVQAWFDLFIFIVQCLRYKKMCRELADHIDRQRFDVVWIEKCSFLSSTYLLRYLKTRTVYYCQEPWRDGYERIETPESEKLGTGLKGRLMKWALDARRNLQKYEDARNAKSASLILTNSFYTQGYIREAYGVDSKVCYLGVDDSLFCPRSRKREKMIVSVGRLETRKRHDLAIRALGLVPADQRPSLVIVASWDMPFRRASLQALADELGVEVKFEFKITDEQLLEFYNTAFAVFYGALREPFGLAAIEAMSCGTPVVGVREGGLQESIRHGETGLLCLPDPQDAARALERLLKEPALYDAITRNGPDYIRSFWTWKSSVERLECYLFQGELPQEMMVPSSACCSAKASLYK